MQQEQLTNIANAIRIKKGTTELIQATQFADEILNLPSGGIDILEINRQIMQTLDISRSLNFYTINEENYSKQAQLRVQRIFNNILRGQHG